MTPVPILRVARPTDNIEALLRFYEQGLGLGVLYRFEDHDGFDGVILGRAGAPYHFEFTAKRGHAVGRARPGQPAGFLSAGDGHLESSRPAPADAGFDPVPSFNPYWDRDGVTFEDPDGYRIVLQKAAWTR